MTISFGQAREVSPKCSAAECGEVRRTANKNFEQKLKLTYEASGISSCIYNDAGKVITFGTGNFAKSKILLEDCEGYTLDLV